MAVERVTFQFRTRKAKVSNLDEKPITLRQNYVILPQSIEVDAKITSQSSK
jgi:hypothetical protein